MNTVTTETIQIPELLQKEIDFTNELIDDVKLKIPNWKHLAGEIIKQVQEVPIVFCHEQELFNGMIAARNAKVELLKSQYTNQQVYKNATIRIVALDTEAQRYSIEKLVMLQLRLQGLLRTQSKKPVVAKSRY